MKNYPYVRAWGAMLRLSSYYIDDQVALARKENAPQDAMWRSVTGRWHCFHEMTKHNPNRELIAAYVAEVSDEQA